MSASFVTFADLGERTNLKTVDILSTIKKFGKEKELDGIICRINKNFYLKNTKGSISLFYHYFLIILEKISFNYFSARRYEEKICDNFALKNIKASKIVFFHPEYFYKESVLHAKKNGAITIGLATMAHLGTNSVIEEEENKLLNLKKKSHIYKDLLNSNSNLNSFDYIIAFSDFVKKSYIENGFPESKIFVAENDIDVDRFKIASKKDSIFRVLYTAQTGTLKGMHYLLEAWESLNLKNSELILVGDYSPFLPEELKERYKKIINNDTSIKFVGYTRKPEEFYGNASIFILPSLTESNSRVIMEAMASGLPIITTINASGSVIEGENGFMLPIRDSFAIAEKIKFFYENQDMVKKMGNRSREIILERKSFSEKVFEIYNDVLKIEKLNEK